MIRARARAGELSDLKALVETMMPAVTFYQNMLEQERFDKLMKEKIVEYSKLAHSR